MDLQALFASAPPTGWLHRPDLLVAETTTFEPHDNDSKAIEEGFKEALECNDVAAACNWVAIGLLLDQVAFLAKIRRRGYLRLSSNTFQPGPANAVLLAILTSTLLAYLPEAARNYFASLAALHELGANVGDTIRRLIVALKAGRGPLLKGLLATVDFFFLGAAWRGVDYGDKSNRDSRDFHFFGLEDYAEGFSYLYHLYQEHVGPFADNTPLDATAMLTDKCMTLLRDAAHVRAYYEFEILVDILDYRLAFTNAGRLRLTAPTPRMEQAIRLGYIHTTMQSVLFAEDCSSQNVASWRLAGEKMYQVGKQDCVLLLKHPVARFAFGIPDVPGIWDVVTHSELFAEEQLYLLAASKALLTPVGELLDFHVVPHVTLRDILRAQRIIAFLRWYAAHHLMPLAMYHPEKASVVFQSLVPYHTLHKLRYLFGVVVGSDTVDPLIDFWTWNAAGNRVFDVQYQPLLSVGEGRLIPMNVMASSNLLRNALALARKRLYEDGQVDPVSDALAATLRKRTAQVATGVSYRFGTVAGEIDVLAVIDRTVFVFECKNSLLPTGPHELRTSWDYVEKAVTQLSNFRDVFADPAFREYLGQSLGFSVEDTDRLSTGIVMANRMFMGYRQAGHAVRGSYELMQFIEDGTVSIGEESLCYWSGDELSSDDLVRFLDEDITYTPRFESMVQYDQTYVFDKFAVEVETYKLDLRVLARKLGFSKSVSNLSQIDVLARKWETRQRTAWMSQVISENPHLRIVGVKLNLAAKYARLAKKASSQAKRRQFANRSKHYRSQAESIWRAIVRPE
jgi:hypothetical protein